MAFFSSGFARQPKGLIGYVLTAYAALFCAVVCLCGRVLKTRCARARDFVLVIYVGSCVLYHRGRI